MAVISLVVDVVVVIIVIVIVVIIIIIIITTTITIIIIIIIYSLILTSVLSRGSVLAFGTQVRGFKPGRSRRIFKGEKILSTPSFGGEVKPSVPCRRFAACKRSLELRGSRFLGQICRNISRQRRVLPSAARGLSRRSKGGGKKWQSTPKNLSRMQRARAIPVALVSAKSGLRAEY